MQMTSDKLVSGLKVVLEAELEVELSQDEVLILANTLKDFFEVLALIEHKKDCPHKDELENLLKRKWGGKRKINMTINHHDNNN